MSDEQRSARPSQVTWGAGFAVLGGALMVVSAFQGLTDLRSIDTRAQLTKALDSPAARGLGVTVEQATTVMHGLLLLAGAGAAVLTVLAGYALLGHRGARVGLTVLAVVVLVSSLAVDPLLGLGLALAVSMLWSRAARDWFDGRPPAVADPAASAARSGEQPAPVLESGVEPPEEPDARPAGPQQPPPTHGFGGPAQPGPAQPGPAYPAPQYPAPQYPGGGYPQSAYPQAPYPQGPYQPQPHLYGPQQGGPRRAPGVVRALSIVTWVFSGLALAGFVVTGIVLSVDQNDLVDRITSKPEYQNLSLDRGELVAAVWGVLLVFAAWSLIACVLAAFVWRGHEWARILLAVSAGVTALFCLAAMPVSIVHLIASAVVLGLLFSPTSSQWFRDRRNGVGLAPQAPQQRPSSSQGPGQGPGQGQPPVW
ncbi:hypothetical protein [Nocardioides terrisoli]|uniref:hypothetical protein n=1 Tax=Nocardioides terrisoli TaxID=3388267 RepID=UPI00287B803B|nr:hypothetical protein [Nocardioides marmorisolisilvae]